MSENRNHNALVFLTTLSVCLGLVLVGAAAPVSAQSAPGNGNIRAMVRQSLYGNALEELVRELERLREEGDSFDLENELSLLEAGGLLTFATLGDIVADLHFPDGNSAAFDRLGSSAVFVEARSGPQKVSVVDTSTIPQTTRFPLAARPRASLDEPAI